MSLPNLLSQQSYNSLVKLLLENGYKNSFTLSPLSGGTNNKVFHIKADGSSIFMKQYFSSPKDRRDRLKVEFSFCRFAWDRGIRSVPKPIACDWDHHIGLYEFIEGSSVQKDQTKESDVQQVLTLFHDLNRHRNEQEAKNLADASESSFSLLENLSSLNRRFQTFKKMDCSSSVDKEADKFIQKQLVPLWEKISETIIKKASQLSINVKKSIKKKDRCLSHSDIGFHNAIRTADGKLRFIDFEYSGWDDPAKMACVFFSSPKVPVPLQYFKPFIESIASVLHEPEYFIQRACLLLPLHYIRWFCILLNIFSIVGSHRRQFAFGNSDIEKLKFRQLKEVRQLLNTFVLIHKGRDF